jgi:hypothetical protein
VRADTAKLMDTRESTTDYPVIDMHVSREGCVIGHDRFVADHTIMCDMAVSHDPVIVTNNGVTEVLSRSPAYGAKLANRVSITDDKSRRLVSVLLVLRIIADRGKLIDMIILIE